jgi:AcrB/AcrD/AcrF family
LNQQQGAGEADLMVDRATAARFGLTVSQIDNVLYDAFGQRQVSVIYKAQNQYHVVMEVAPEFRQSPEILNQIYISTGGGNVSGTQKTNPCPVLWPPKLASPRAEPHQRAPGRALATPRATRRTTRWQPPVVAQFRPAPR